MTITAITNFRSPSPQLYKLFILTQLSKIIQYTSPPSFVISQRNLDY